MFALLIGIATYVWLLSPKSSEDMPSTRLLNEQPASAVSEQVLLYQPEKALAPFVLQDQHNALFNRTSLEGRWSLVFLGYTYCPDVCPTTLAMLNSVYPKLQDVSDKPVQIVFVSADPERDTPARLNEYIGYFNPEFVAATGPHPDLFPLTRNLGLAYAMYDGETPDSYTVDHSASIVLVNPNGNIQAVFRPHAEPGQLATIRSKQLVSDFKDVLSAVQ